MKTLDSFCVVKEGKHSRHFNVLFARVLQSLAGWEYFPYVFGVFDEKLGMELIIYEDKKVVTVSRMQNKKKLTSADCNIFCFSLASAVMHMHLNNLLHNDLMLNNVLLKFRNNVWIIGSYGKSCFEI